MPQVAHLAGGVETDDDPTGAEVRSCLAAPVARGAACTCRPDRARTATSPIGWPWAARNVKHIAAADHQRVDDVRAAPRRRRACRRSWRRRARRRTAASGCRADPSSTSTSFCQQRPGIADGKRTAAGRRSTRVPGATRRTRRSHRGRRQSISLATNAGSLPSSPACRTAGSPGARRRVRARRGARAPASIEYFGLGSPFGPAEVAGATTVAPALGQPGDRGQCGTDAEVVGDLDRPSSGTLKSVRTNTRLPLTSPRSSKVGIPLIMAMPQRLGRRTFGAGVQRSCRRGGSSSPTRCRTTTAP